MRYCKRGLTWGAVCLAALLAVVWVAPRPVVHAQDKSKSKKSAKTGRSRSPTNTKSLDIKADQIQSSFTKEAEDLAGQYYEAGQYDKAKALLDSVLAVNPEAPNIKEKLEKIKEGVMISNEFEIDVSPSQGWKQTGVQVIEKRSFRIKAEGTYRFEVSASGTTAAGFPDKDPGEDMTTGIPCGALMGVISDNGKSGKPFLVGEQLEDFTPREGGLLFLRINAPVGNKSSGKIRVTISGNVQASN